MHPDLAQAQEGYADEERRGVPIDAPHRNYKDANHKPELICALTPFDGLCGFRDPAGGRRPARRPGRRLPQAVRRPAARPPRGGRPARGADRRPHRGPRRRWPATVTEAAAAAAHTRSAAPYAAVRRSIAHHYPGDPGVIAAMLLNHVRLQPGEALFLGAGVPHAYLDGLGVEIMANSDNVLRCGLTPKHVDVPELLRIVRFEAERPRRTAPRGRPPTARRSTRPRSTSSASPATSSPQGAAARDLTAPHPADPAVHGGLRRSAGEHANSPPGESVFVPAGEKAEVSGDRHGLPGHRGGLTTGRVRGDG